MAFLPDEVFDNVSASLKNFLDSPEASFFFAEADSAGKADCVARYLCGRALPWDTNDGTFGGLVSTPTHPTRESVRILLTGCFDLMHAGHYNALRQAKAAFHKDGYKHVHLVAGVHSDEAITGQKGPPVIPHEERVALVKACKWVDEVAIDLPYAVPVKLLDDLKCDYCVHGDDLPTVGSGGLFDEVMKAGRLRIVKRTEGTSTTELIGRLISMSREHQMKCSISEGSQALVSTLSQRPRCWSGDSTSDRLEEGSEPSQALDVVKPVLLPTIGRMVDFYRDMERKNKEANLANRRVVYVPGIWDLFHVGHARFLEQAAKEGDYVLVGALGDADVNKRLGYNNPLQTLHERTLSVLSCRFVDDVLLGAPWKITQDMLTSMNISVVCCGATDFWNAAGADLGEQGDPFELPRELGILRRMESGCNVTVHVLADRIFQHAEAFAVRQKRKEVEEKKYTDGKTFVPEV
mmetsp:Transcript_90874/g.142725  ORF Transcript_90874/g.142725 Transcript_90874/m.142725 type:complete len:464 (+) Transcript_90874:44-1435(+)